MINTIISAIGVYISTSIDYLLILVILFAQLHSKREKLQIYAGQYLGTAVLVSISLFAAYVVNFIPDKWIVGLLGLIPLFIGIKFALSGEDEDETEEIREKIEQDKSKNLLWTVVLLTIASGGDNLGVYIPYFSSLNWSKIIIVLIIFAIGIAILCELSRSLSKIPMVSEIIEKYEKIIVPVVFIALGIYIMYENGTIQTIVKMLGI
ncbi:CadD family cadmium resistance transporter [Helcococcus kunzii]|uniref:Cadmium resistance transporter n=1 Tax=Helcococcus kunzii ATCC 51366 TaxID=883114 RepID=H3NKZ1_9FIRM|nr:CadD family cadmium resistance transporter [Helcococcus kunzii]EHR36415.1 cadmium resistance transporter [Helcococcus kunzii ATCC 51366]MCT1796990.1 CadD family cadmium resistance transporter [Helcococcus kunzii]MCT1988453.1 CadD family cadmium resistance transporter [Helcococcus kunzii]QUY65697.1 CadD family cadmium resistance transporter [Helcococcus kunzii]QZO76411.1 CadD family cadmium resistance transporter [Helcococcus kunzii]